MFTSLLGNQIELMVLTLLVLLLFTYRHFIGQAPLYIMSGVYYIFVLLLDAPRMASHNAVPVGASSLLGHGLLWLPFLLLLLLVYQQESTIAAQRFYLGLVIATACFLIMVLLVCSALPSPQARPLHDFLSLSGELFTTSGRYGLLIGALTHLFAFMLVPTAFQAFMNRGARHFTATFAVMLIYLAVSEAMIVINAAIIHGAQAYIPLSPNVWIVRITTVFWLSLLGHFFMGLAPVQQRARRGPFQFLTGFLNFFVSTDKIMRSIDEWSERYQIVVENSSELILITSPGGQILNANRAAFQHFGPALDRPGFSFDQVITDADGAPWNWRAAMPPPGYYDESAPARQIRQFRSLVLRVPGRRPVELDVNISAAALNGQAIAIIIGRDVTAQRIEERQRKSQAEQMMHSQRLESIGQLAGGIAHDFNNLMLSIQASVDALNLRYQPEGEPRQLLANVEEACRRATTLTSQLLGFAHKGKYHAVDLDVPELLAHSLQLFLPTAKGISCRQLTEPVPLVIHGDEIQLSQVLLNMLINSRDALENTPDPRKITLRAESVRPGQPEWESRPDHSTRPEDFIAIQIRDNGSGMPETTKARIFDPFFTTKPAGKGTGMGLAMAFGCITNHHGWIHVASTLGKGTTFTIFLPRAKPQA